MNPKNINKPEKFLKYLDREIASKGEKYVGMEHEHYRARLRYEVELLEEIRDNFVRVFRIKKGDVE